jgi:hypothetical protein
MNGLHQIGVVREGWQPSRLIGPEARGDIVLWSLASGELEPSERVFEGAPAPFKGVPRWAIRRPEHAAHGFRHGELLGRMRPPVIQEQDIQAVRESLREQVDEELEHGGMQRGELPAEPLACRRRHRAIDRAPRDDRLDWSHGLHATGREAPAPDGHAPDAAFVVAEDPDEACVRRWDALLQAFSPGSLEGWNGLRIFWCAWGAGLCAWS